MEHCIPSSIWPNLNKYNKIMSKKHGNRKGMSCEAPLIETIYDRTNTLNRGKGQIAALILDSSKDLDNAPHHCLFMTNKSHR